MAKDNYTLIHMNGNLSDYSSAHSNGLGSVYLAYVKSLQTFPSWITNNIFNIIYALGIIANIVLLVYLIFYKRYKTPVFIVILSLCVADSGVCVGSLLHYNCVFPFILGPQWLCRVTRILMFLSFTSSSYHIALFAVLRFIQLVYPLTSHTKVTTGLLIKICLIIWVIDSIQALAFAFYYESVKVSSTGNSVTYVCFYLGNQHVKILWFTVVWCVIPFISASGFHVAKQVMVLLAHSATVPSQDERVQQVRKQTDTRVLAIVIVLYLVCLFPFILQAIRVYVLKLSYSPINVYLVELFGQLAYSNSAINPWIYMFAAESVRSDIRKMLTRNK